MTTITTTEPEQPPRQEHEGGHKTSRTKRSRWATRKLTVKSSNLKRLSLLGRANGKNASAEKKRASGGTESLRNNDAAETESVTSEAAPPRTLYFNQPLPDDLKDEHGDPITHFTRNKIRTAKYTPLSFIPKNIWFQFHNIANIFFLFLVILVVSILPPPAPFIRLVHCWALG